MIQTLDDFYGQVGKYTKLFDMFVQKHELEGKGKSDHICYKCDSSKMYEAIRKLFEADSEFVYQSIISERRIAVIKMKRPVKTLLGDIVYLELSDQRPDLSQTEGFDHIEVYSVGWSYEDMVSFLSSREVVKKIERPHHTTHDIDIGDGFLWRCTRGPLVEKIKDKEMA